MSKLDRLPARVALVDAQGLLTREGTIYLQQLGARVGGTTAPTIPEVSEAAQQAAEAAQVAQAAADAAAEAAQRASDSAAFAATQPQAKGMTVDEVVLLVLSLQQTVTNLSEELRRLRDLETYTFGG